MFRFALAASALALSACSPPVPDSGAGVGFQNYSDYNSYRAARENELRAEAVQPPVRVPAQPVAPAAPPRVVAEAPITSETLSQAGIGSRPATVAIARPAPVATAPIAPAPAPTTVTTATAAPPVQGRVVAVPENDASISDEQNFAAVSDRQTIESDAERLRAQRQAYEVIAPTALPTRSGAEGPNIVRFALTTRNRVGQQAYSRSALSGNARYQRNCAKYNSPDLAQEAFLSAGGPERDRMGIDPDGDGFACAWDPTPFRKVGRTNG